MFRYGNHWCLVNIDAEAMSSSQMSCETYASEGVPRVASTITGTFEFIVELD
jgi:hypothetical protein